MNGGNNRPPLHDRNRSAPDSPDGREPRRGATVEILVGGFRIPGIIEYSAREGNVTFTRGSSSRLYKIL